MRLRMLTTVRGSRDGSTVELFAEGSIVELGGHPREEDLKQVLLREKWAEEVREERAMAPQEHAAIPSAPENASASEAPESEPVSDTESYAHAMRRRRKG